MDERGPACAEADAEQYEREQVGEQSAARGWRINVDRLHRHCGECRRRCDGERDPELPSPTMRVLVVVANPDPNSYSHAISERVERGLRSAGHDVVVRDLCAEQFRAAMSAEERVAYHSDTPVLDPMVQDHIDDLQSAQGIVFVLSLIHI